MSIWRTVGGVYPEDGILPGNLRSWRLCGDSIRQTWDIIYERVKSLGDVCSEAFPIVSYPQIRYNKPISGKRGNPDV